MLARRLTARLARGMAAPSGSGAAALHSVRMASSFANLDEASWDASNPHMVQNLGA